MTIGERIFLRLGEIGMSQKDFSEKTGIAQSTISEWKTKKNNPTADKILIICDVLDVSPYWLLSGTEKSGKRGNNTDYFVIGKETELGSIVSEYNGLGQRNALAIQLPSSSLTWDLEGGKYGPEENRKLLKRAA